jgi:hypothetical protein
MLLSRMTPAWRLMQVLLSRVTLTWRMTRWNLLGPARL